MKPKKSLHSKEIDICKKIDSILNRSRPIVTVEREKQQENKNHFEKSTESFQNKTAKNSCEEIKNSQLTKKPSVSKLISNKNDFSMINKEGKSQKVSAPIGSLNFIEKERDFIQENKKIGKSPLKQAIKNETEPTPNLKVPQMISAESIDPMPPLTLKKGKIILKRKKYVLICCINLNRLLASNFAKLLFHSFSIIKSIFLFYFQTEKKFLLKKRKIILRKIFVVMKSLRNHIRKAAQNNYTFLKETAKPLLSAQETKKNASKNNLQIKAKTRSTEEKLREIESKEDLKRLPKPILKDSLPKAQEDNAELKEIEQSLLFYQKKWKTLF